MSDFEPLITITKKQFDDLENTLKQCLKDKDALTVLAYRSLLTSLLREVPKIPGFQLEAHLKMAADHIEKTGHKLKEVAMEEDPNDNLMALEVKREGEK